MNRQRKPLTASLGRVEEWVQIQINLFLRVQIHGKLACTYAISEICTLVKSVVFNRDFIMNKYEQLEESLRDQIRAGQLSPGQRLPSIRQLRNATSLSKSTVLAAYSHLEAEGLIEARPRSGYFVRAANKSYNSIKMPANSSPSDKPHQVSTGQVLIDIMKKGAAFDLIPAPGPQSGDSIESLRRCIARAVRKQSLKEQAYYDEPQGSHVLRSQLSHRMLQGGSRVSADDLVITSGCQHSLLLALMATTAPGDIVAVESPGFYGAFQLLEALGLKALELPSSADHGLSADALELALQHWSIKVLMLSPAFATPTGACMPESAKRQILSLAKKHDLAIIEDDIYGDLFFDLQRPRTLHSYDDSGSVLLCSSFSKSLSRDLRIGWILPGKYLEKVRRLKVVTSLAGSLTMQNGISEYLSEGAYDRFLRQRRLQYRQQCEQLQSLIEKYLPMSEACSRPTGGLSLWLELPAQIDSLDLFFKAKQKGISITPGPLFTAQNRYKNFLRLSFFHPWTEERENALNILGDLILST